MDYREECDDKDVRWLFRTHSNEGDWSGNIYDFFCKVRTRMDDDVDVPFANRRDGYRVDRVDVHDALEEALANAPAHANYYGRRGIVVIKKGKELSISNPGTIRVTKDEFYAGGNSDPRNPNILKMFGFVNVGERAEKTEEFKAMLERRTGLPVILWDERLTTVEADEILEESGVPRSERKKVIDKIAATLILQSYLGSRK